MIFERVHLRECTKYETFALNMPAWAFISFIHAYAISTKISFAGPNMFKGGTSFVDRLCYLSLVFAMLSCLLIAALWSPAGKGLTSMLLFVMSNYDFVTLPCGILCHMWYLIVLIPGLSYFSLTYSPTPKTGILMK